MSYIKRMTAILLSTMMVVVYLPVFSFAETETTNTDDPVMTEVEAADELEIIEKTDGAEAEEIEATKKDAANSNTTDTVDETDGAKGTRGGVEIIDSGTCGDNLTWTLDIDGLLTISGTGEMDSSKPWLSNKDKIRRVKVENGVTSIRNLSFSGCSNLTGITLPESVTSIGELAFNNCSSLTGITLPESVTSIEGSTFYGCSSLTSIDIPKSVTSIEEEAFYGCSSLTGITFSYGVTSIGDLSFSGCSSLTSITLPESVTSIGEMTFNNCSSLTSIDIPKSVTSIGMGAFSDCNNLSEVHYGGSQTSWGSISIGSNNTGLLSATIYYEDGIDSGTCGDNLTWTLDSNGLLTISGTGEMSSFGAGGSPWNSNKDTVSTVIIEDGVTRIGNLSFYGCSNLTSITLPDSVKSIGESAFYNCSMTSISIPAGVTSIEYGAFAYCRSLTSITLPDSVTSIGDAAFQGCSSLSSITLPNGVTSIGDDVFAFCSLTSISIPAGVTSIGQSAFTGCSSLRSIRIPSSVTSIGENAFYNCSSLSKVRYGGSQASWGSISIGSNNTSLLSATIYYNDEIDSGTCGDNLTWTLTGSETEMVLTISGTGVMTDYTDEASVPWKSNRTNIKSVVIEDGVTSIGEYSFYGCSNAASITIADSVKRIGQSAFYGCSSASRITIPSGVTNIAKNAFYNCSSLTRITIPNGVTIIRTGTFYGCSGLTSVTLTKNLESIGASAFCGCSSLESIHIPSVLADGIENSTFKNCTSLRSITFTGGMINIGDSAFEGCSSLTDIVIPDRVQSIGNKAFDGCSSLTGITFPGTALTFGDYALRNCSSLKSISVPASTIGQYAFDGCSSLTDITFTTNAKMTIGNYAFRDCSNLEEININSISTYLKNSFRNNTASPLYNAENGKIYVNGEELTELIIPESITSIGYYALAGCSSLTNVVIPESVTSVGNYSFYNCKGLKNVTIQGSETSFLSNVFSGTAIKNVFFSGTEEEWKSKNVSSIGDAIVHFEATDHSYGEPVPEQEATCTASGMVEHYECSVCHALFIKEGDEYIEKTAEELETEALGHDYVDGVCSRCGAGDVIDSGTCGDNLTWTLTGTENEMVLTISGTGAMDLLYSDCPWSSYRKSITTIVIEDGVTSIGGYAFYGCSRLTNVVIPEGVTSIGYYAFCDCSSLASVVIPDGVTSIGNSAFSDCSSLTSVEIPEGLMKIGIMAFYGCSSLTSVEIPKGVMSIEDRTFYDCSSLTSISIPDSVTSIGSCAFSYCSNLTSIEIPDSVTSIGDRAFEGCSRLTSAEIPKGVMSIEEHTFYGCSSLTSVEIPDGVTSIEMETFSGCSSLTSVEIPDSVTSIGSSAFSYCSSLTSIDIPDGVTRIGANAFEGCSSLTSISIPDGVTSIGSRTFYSCSRLTSVEIPDSVTSIGDYVFYCCSSLTSVVIPEGVTSIEEFTFYGCSSLTSIVIPEDVTSIGYYAFTEIDNNYVVYTTPNSYASNYFDPQHVRYLCEDSDPVSDQYLGFKTDRIIIPLDDIVSLEDYIVTSADFSECSVELSDNNNFMYSGGSIYAASEGSCDITVTCGDMSATARLMATNETVATGSLSLADSALTMNIGDKVINKVMIGPQNATDTDLTWTSSDEALVTVTDGLITAITPGTATVTAALTGDSSIKATCEVTVENPLKAIVTLEEVEPYTIEKGTSKKLQHYAYPSNATNYSPEYTSSDPGIISIDGEGRMTAHGNGTVQITITSGKITKTVDVTAYTVLTGISLDKSRVNLYIDEETQLNVIYEPEGATGEVTWSSNNETVATVDENGQVTAHAVGIAKITAQSGEFTATCTIICPNVAMTGIGMPEAKEIEYGTSYTAEITYLPENTTDDRTAVFESGDETVFTVSDDGTVTPTGIGTATLTATVRSFTAATEITVIKATPEYTVPEGIIASCGQTLSDVELPDGFAWEDDTLNVGSVGTGSFTAVYTPEDTDHYKAVTGITIEVEVRHHFEETWKRDDSGHWHECACGERSETAEHSYGEWVVTEEASCTEEGVKERVCSVCGHKETGTVTVAGHELTEHAAIAPTCTATGSSAYWSCDKCGKIFSDADGTSETTMIDITIPAKGHIAEDIAAVAATCTEKGSTAGKKCSVCGEILEEPEETDALGHDWGEWTVTKEATEDEDGLKTRVCGRDGSHAEEEVIPKLSHTHSMVKTKAAGATCTTDGNIEYWTCSKCGKFYSDEAGENDITEADTIVKAKGHTEEIIPEVAATCTEKGSTAGKKCSVCGEILTAPQEVAALGHTPAAAVKENEVKATSSSTGSYDEVVYCSVCKAEISRTKKTTDKLPPSEAEKAVAEANAQNSAASSDANEATAKAAQTAISEGAIEAAQVAADKAEASADEAVKKAEEAVAKATTAAEKAAAQKALATAKTVKASASKASASISKTVASASAAKATTAKTAADAAETKAAGSKKAADDAAAKAADAKKAADAAKAGTDAAVTAAKAYETAAADAAAKAKTAADDAQAAADKAKAASDAAADASKKAEDAVAAAEKAEAAAKAAYGENSDQYKAAQSATKAAKDTAAKAKTDADNAKTASDKAAANAKAKKDAATAAATTATKAASAAKAAAEAKKTADHTGTPEVTLSKAELTYAYKVQKIKVGKKKKTLAVGTIQKPSVESVRLNGNVLKAGTDYDVAYSNEESANIGTYTVTVTLKGDYSGKGTATYTINPKAVNLKKAAKGKKSFTASWKKLSKNDIKYKVIGGYQLRYSTDPTFPDGSTKVIKAGTLKSAKKAVKKLQAKTTYYVQLRTYKAVSGVTYYSVWSPAKTVVTK